MRKATAAVRSDWVHVEIQLSIPTMICYIRMEIIWLYVESFDFGSELMVSGRIQE